MPGYLSKPSFLIKGLESSMSSPARRKQLRKAELLPGFKRKPAKAAPRGVARPAEASTARAGSKK